MDGILIKAKPTHGRAGCKVIAPALSWRCLRFLMSPVLQAKPLSVPSHVHCHC
jgi:hypothetical protein